MTLVSRVALALAAGVAFLGVVAADAGAQEARLAGRVAEPFRGQVEAILDSATRVGLPTEPLVDRALEGAAMRASGDRIVQAVRRLAGELEQSRSALGPRATPQEIVSGAAALRAGAQPEQLTALRRLRGEQSVMVAAGVLADLVAVGVPRDTAVAAVMALAALVDDAEYVAFRQNVERDIELGASPVAAIGVRLSADNLNAVQREGGVPTRPAAPATRQPRKP